MAIRPIRWVLAGLFAGAFALTGCSASNGSAEAAPVTGKWQSSDNGEPFLTFAEDGTYKGSDGCNGLGGTYEQDGDIVRLEPGVSTLMGCPGVNTWLRNAHTIVVKPDGLEVHDRSDAVIGTLARHNAAGS